MRNGRMPPDADFLAALETPFDQCGRLWTNADTQQLIELVIEAGLSWRTTLDVSRLENCANIRQCEYQITKLCMTMRDGTMKRDEAFLSNFKEKNKWSKEVTDELIALVIEHKKDWGLIAKKLCQGSYSAEKLHKRAKYLLHDMRTGVKEMVPEFDQVFEQKFR